MPESTNKSSMRENYQQSRFKSTHLFGAVAILLISILSASYIPQYFFDLVKSYMLPKSSVALPPLLEADQLNKILEKKNFHQNYRVIEAFFSDKFHENFDQEHIPQAIYFDTLHGADSNEYIPKNIPSQEKFEEYVGSLGISNDHHVIIYDRSDNGFLVSGRAWFLFKLFGHDKVSILNGGMNYWKNSKFDTTKDSFYPAKAEFKTNFNKNMIRSFEQIQNNVKTKEMVIIDSREAESFNKVHPESGINEHIPNSINIPYSSLFDAKQNLLKNPSELKKLFENNDIDLERPMIIGCMFGVRSCTTVFAAYLSGAKSFSLYLGSWNEYHQKIKQ
ncbi:3-mercaptopyruvate sulfurtransferase [Brachionus plicatilis]|uniref:3-mercaptopyruvate sulfurtransferase n=1 Tax=Brachionus plicatilis TaxID=10195 RepID=A0A3M7QB51_BRAPC|nr:3-mercaptopyruvate sulfurtransferase [Brachionus plicatilis]